MKYRMLALAATIANVVALLFVARAAAHVKSDPIFLAALRSDREVGRCACVVDAAWIDASYPRVTVDAVRWKGLAHTARATFTAQALRVAEATSLTELGVPDQDEQIFIYDVHNRLLLRYPS